MAESAGVSYTGELDGNGKYTGFGRLEYVEKGEAYEGTFADGAYHGEGKLCYANGVEYTAQWERGLEVAGTGSLSFPDGLVYNPTQNLGASGSAAAAAAPSSASSPNSAGAGAAAGQRAIGVEWGYLSGSIPGGHDRRLWEEHQAGRRAAVQARTSPSKVQAGRSLAEVQGLADGRGDAERE